MVLVASACTTSPSPSLPGTTPTATSSPSATGRTTIVRTYFFLGSFTDNAGLAPVERTVPQLEPAGALQSQALDALIAGPNDAELRAAPAMYSVIPEGSTVLGLDFAANGLVTVNLSRAFQAGGGSASERGRLAQVVYTLTQWDSITAVRFAIDGTPVTSFGSSAIPLDHPVSRADFTDQLPAIFIDDPAWGGTLGQPAHLAGLANAFEATFHVRILDAGGHALADGPAMATCGTGCWGAWDLDVPYVVAVAGPGTLQAYELSAADGSPTNLTAYPVTLRP
jgi:spore germination protein GerM